MTGTDAKKGGKSQPKGSKKKAKAKAQENDDEKPSTLGFQEGPSRKQKPKKDNTVNQKSNPKKNVDAMKKKKKNQKAPTSKDLKNRVSALINTALSTALAQLDILEEEK